MDGQIKHYVATGNRCSSALLLFIFRSKHIVEVEKCSTGFKHATSLSSENIHECGHLHWRLHFLKIDSPNVATIAKTIFFCVNVFLRYSQYIPLRNTNCHSCAVTRCLCSSIYRVSSVSSTSEIDCQLWMQRIDQNKWDSLDMEKSRKSATAFDEVE